MSKPSPESAPLLSAKTVEALTQLFERIVPRLPQRPPYFARKYQRSDEGIVDALVELPNGRKPEVVGAFLTAMSSAEFKSQLDQIEEDARIKENLRRAGNRSALRRLLETAFRDGLRFNGNVAHLDVTAAVSALEETLKWLESKSLEFRGACCVYGLSLNEDEIEVEDGIKLYQLSRDEMNVRQLPQGSLNTHLTHQLALLHPVELRVKRTISVKEGEQPIADAGRDAVRMIRNDLKRARNALQFWLNEKIAFGPIEVRGYNVHSTWGETSQVAFLKPLTCMHLVDIRIVRRAFAMLNESNPDTAIRAGIRRFVQAFGKPDVHDSFVDCVIALDAILTSFHGSNTAAEFSYRFRLNGSVLLPFCIPKLAQAQAFDQLRELFELRSAIVHGKSEVTIAEKLKTFGTFAEAFSFARQAFRGCVILLGEIPHQQRPYVVKFGWEQMLWGQTCGSYSAAAATLEELLARNASTMIGTSDSLGQG